MIRKFVRTAGGAFLVLFAGAIGATAQSTAFTYQGCLTEGGIPANGSYDLRFALYDALTGGSQQGLVVTNAATGVSNGLFTVVIDFGAGVFPGAARWMEVAVRTTGASSFVTLNPRQPVTPVPYAVFALAGSGGTTSTQGSTGSTSAWTLTGNSGTAPGVDFIGTTDNQPLTLKGNGIGINKTNPAATLDVNGSVSASSFSGHLIAGSGDGQTARSIVTTGQWLQLGQGVAASPDAGTNPVVKVNRLIQMNKTAIFGDGGEQLAGVTSVCVGTDSDQVQPVGIYGGAKTSSTNKPAGGGFNDACGVYGVGSVINSGTGYGMGAYFEGRRNTATGHASTIQLQTVNNTKTADTYNPNVTPATMGVWLVAGGTNCGVGLVIGNPIAGQQYDVGIAANGQVNNGHSGSIATTFIRDDSSGLNSIVINGSHRTGIDLSGAAISGNALNLAPGQKLAGGTLTSVNEAITTTPKASNYTALTTDRTITCDTSAGGFTVALPASPNTGEILRIKKISTDTNTLMISGNGRSIDGASTFAMASSGRPALTVQYDGTQWWIL